MGNPGAVEALSSRLLPYVKIFFFLLRTIDPPPVPPIKVFNEELTDDFVEDLLMMESLEEAMQLLGMDLTVALKAVFLEENHFYPLRAPFDYVRAWRDECLAFRKVKERHLVTEDLGTRGDDVAKFYISKLGWNGGARSGATTPEEVAGLRAMSMEEQGTQQVNQTIETSLSDSNAQGMDSMASALQRSIRPETPNRPPSPLSKKNFDAHSDFTHHVSGKRVLKNSGILDDTR